MKEVTIRISDAGAQILRHDLHALITVAEQLKDKALERMNDETLDEFTRETARDSNELLSFKIGIYRTINAQILKQFFDIKL